MCCDIPIWHLLHGEIALVGKGKHAIAVWSTIKCQGNSFAGGALIAPWLQSLASSSPFLPTAVDRCRDLRIHEVGQEVDQLGELWLLFLSWCFVMWISLAGRSVEDQLLFIRLTLLRNSANSFSTSELSGPGGCGEWCSLYPEPFSPLNIKPPPMPIIAM